MFVDSSLLVEVEGAIRRCRFCGVLTKILRGSRGAESSSSGVRIVLGLRNFLQRQRFSPRGQRNVINKILFNFWTAEGFRETQRATKEGLKF